MTRSPVLWRGGLSPYREGASTGTVAPAYISQRCACCSHTAEENRQTQSKFVCEVCGYTGNADIHGACNILAAGHAVLTCGGMVQPGCPLKQKPTEANQTQV
nr:zinc ribbon domain-containing protein [Escherichia coli]